MTIQAAFDFPLEIKSLKKTTEAKARRSGAFTDNMSLPVHRWFRYSAGFSAEWVEQSIAAQRFEAGDYIFDPFVGSGTTLLAAQRAGINSAGAEHHPFVFRIASAKLAWNQEESALLSAGSELLREAKATIQTVPASASKLLIQCYTEEALCRLEALRDTYWRRHSPSELIGELIWLAITSILRECSGVGTAQWQYVLPNKTKAKIKDPFAAFASKISILCADIVAAKSTYAGAISELRFSDARSLSEFAHLNGQVRLVVTSPPYPNNYDYADATRLEMTFWNELKGWGDLQSVVRHKLIRSCSQHSAAEKLQLDELLSEPSVIPIREELTAVCRQLEAIRLTKGGKKTYHTMIAAYFVDLAKTWHSLRRLCADGGRVCFVVGDSAPYGIHVPVERWLGELAIAAGFRSWAFEKIRDRNIKWKNRKHRVPLVEGNLWVEA